MLIKNAHVVDPANGVNEVCDIYIEDGLITAVGDQPSDFYTDSEIDATGKYVFPGIVDLCARLREPGQENKATIHSETRAAASGGITTMVCPPDTFPIIDTPAMAHMIQNRADESGFARVRPLGALTLGLKGEQLTDMAMLMDAGCVGVSNAVEAVRNTLVIRRAMQYASTYDIPVFLMPVDSWLQGNGVVHEGRVSTMLGLPAIPEAAETVGVARDLALIETSGARAHFEMVSCGRSVTMIEEARCRKLPVTASVSIHHLLFSENHIGAFNTQFKVMPPFRTDQDKVSLLEGVASGAISTICSDHQPHGADSKLAPFSEAATGIAGLDTLLSLTWGLVQQNLLELNTAIAALTFNPATIINVDAGHLSVGAPADLCIFDPDMSWKLDSETMQSRGRNSPLIGEQLDGRVIHTLLGGKTVYSLSPNP
jgi:dihydroorotase